MPDSNENYDKVLRFIVEEIDTVPELEALLLLSEHRSTSWTAADLAKRLYIDGEQTRGLLAGLTRKQFVTMNPGEPETYRYEP